MSQKALVIDLHKCVGCHACATNCKAWNTQGDAGPLTDTNPYAKKPEGVWFNRVQTYEVGKFPDVEVVHLPKSCMHCKNAPCVEVCPTGASYKRVEDGIVLVNYDGCIGCKYCSWACPYGCREFDEFEGVMKKCTLCVDRIYNEALPEEERKPACVIACPAKARAYGDIDDPASQASRWIAEGKGYKLMPESGADPSNHYLPKRKVKIHVDKEALLKVAHAHIEAARNVACDTDIVSEDVAQP